MSKSTVYRHIELWYYTTSKIDLPRVAKFKPRKVTKGKYVPKGAKIGGTFNDFILFLDKLRLKLSVTVTGNLDFGFSKACL